KQVAKHIGKSLSYVNQKLEILKYPENVREALQDGKIVFSVARELVRLKNVNLRDEYLKHAVRGGATPALVKEWVDDILRAEKAQVKSDDDMKAEGGMQNIPLTEYFCFICGGKADVTNSGLYRGHHKCAEKLQGGE
ncbi:MAG TPA: hypothetical protein VIY47_10540, partial [Ignavibacteriaceae bacterium]